MALLFFLFLFRNSWRHLFFSPPLSLLFDCFSNHKIISSVLFKNIFGEPARSMVCLLGSSVSNGGAIPTEKSPQQSFGGGGLLFPWFADRLALLIPFATKKAGGSFFIYSKRTTFDPEFAVLCCRWAFKYFMGDSYLVRRAQLVVGIASVFCERLLIVIPRFFKL